MIEHPLVAQARAAGEGGPVPQRWQLDVTPDELRLIVQLCTLDRAFWSMLDQTISGLPIPGERRAASFLLASKCQAALEAWVKALAPPDEGGGDGGPK